MDKIPMTPEGHEALQEELKNLKTVERPAIVKAIAAAREHGDLSENAEYHAARERQSFVEGRIGELEDTTKRAEIIDTTKLKGKTVRFGAKVKLADEETDEEATYQLVGEFEADIEKRKISIMSPLGKALIGREMGDSVEVTTPNGVRYFEVVSVRFR
ncbi:MAG: transcription elongation factor GreA [Rhodospirillaceae bacterium]|jgi:transcription elongation factor GreA|nr:transcription elongation factor GreA [Rhodospirillaceae bacterium]MBT5944921.1 transcription elongation factor GreA [Rhodospirillaceae bacterium]MBT6404487.1 transcription elongation factor GreA [Rhodospirillaceae bacterium]MBT6535969.1 transcription elongation factor GreA [Rhodospirillaceae bacterium]MBT7361915.1 transcription elongation factor GreA [Rhodospirillaceae bacterium]